MLALAVVFCVWTSMADVPASKRECEWARENASKHKVKTIGPCFEREEK